MSATYTKIYVRRWDEGHSLSLKDTFSILYDTISTLFDTISPIATFFSLPTTFFDPSTTLFNLSATLSVHLRHNSSNSHFSYHICSVPKFILTPPHMMYLRRIILCTLIGGCHTLITTQIIFVQNARHTTPADEE